MTTVRQPISRLPEVEALALDSLIPILENPNTVNKRTVSATVQQIGDIVATAALSSVSVRVGLFINNSPLDGELLLRLQFPEPVMFPQDMVDSIASCVIPATSQAVFSVQKDGVEFATITFDPGETDAVIDGDETIFNEGDVLTIVAPGSADPTLSVISITLGGGLVE